MIGQTVKELLLEKQENFLIDGDKVATLLDTHPLTHAFLVLTKVGYTKIPVLNSDDELVGFIGLAQVVDNMLAIDGVDFAQLDGKIVSDVMDSEVASIREFDDVERLFHLAVDHAFIPVTNEKNEFIGIVTRRELFKAINHLIHTIESDYDILKKKNYELVK